jgi:hypothetical protein
MELEEIENNYTLAVSKANESFLSRLQKKEKKEVLEREYKEELKKAYQNYERSMKILLKNNKSKKPRKKEKKEKKEHFENKEVKYQRTFLQNLKMRWKIRVFIISIGLKRLEERMWSSSLSFEQKKLKVRIKHFIWSVKSKTSYVLITIKKKTLSNIEKTNNFFKERYEKFKEFITSLKNKIKLKKKTEQKENSQAPSSTS